MTLSQTTLLIRDAQAGDEQARERLFTLIYEKHMRAHTHRYRSRNVLVDDADIESEFMLGCLKALSVVQLDKGDPLLYMFWKGNLAVAHLLRTRIQKGVMASCHSCGGSRPIQTVRGRPTCRSCGSDDVETYMVVEPESLVREDKGQDTQVSDRIGAERVASEAELVWGIATFGIQIQEMRGRLRGRVRELFDLIVLEEVNRETSKNYILEIATKWGVSTACVAIYLRKLRASIEEYLGE